MENYIMSVIEDIIFPQRKDSTPYSDIVVSDHITIRTFDPTSTEVEEYVWHRDHEDREIAILEGEGWKFQFDNELPFNINKGDIFFVPKMVFHRIIPGSCKLKVKINEQIDHGNHKELVVNN